MSALEIKKMSLLALNQDRRQLLRQMQKLQCVQIIRGDAGENPAFAPALDDRAEHLAEEVARLDRVISMLRTYERRRNRRFSMRPPSEDDILLVQAERDDLRDAAIRAEEIERRRLEARDRKARLKALIEEMTPWIKLDIPFQRINDPKSVKLALLRIPTRRYDAFKQSLSSTAYMKRIGADEEGLRVLIAAHIKDFAAVESAALGHSAVWENFSPIRGTPAQAIEEASASIRDIDRSVGDYGEELSHLANRLDSLRLLRDLNAMEIAQINARDAFLETRSAFLMTAWVPAGKIKDLEKRLWGVSRICQIEFADPEKGDDPPILYKSRPRLVEFFLSIFGRRGANFTPLGDNAKYVSWKE